VISQIWGGATTAERMKIEDKPSATDLLPQNVLFQRCIHVDYAGRSSVTLDSVYKGQNGDFQPPYAKKTWQTVSNTATVTINHQKEIVDLL